MNQIQEEFSSHQYRTEIPNIVFEMGLNPYELAIYCHMKRTAGDGGTCFKSCQRLSNEVGCHRSKFIEVKKSLQEKGLIRITHRKKEDGGCTSDVITIIDLWPRNVQFMQEKKNKLHPPVAIGDTPLSPVETPPVAKNDSKKEHLLRKENVRKRSDVPSFIQEIDEITEEDKKILSRYPEENVKAAIEYNKVVPPIESKIKQLMYFSRLDKPVKIPKNPSNHLYEYLLEWSKNNESSTCTLRIDKKGVVFDHSGQGVEKPMVKFSEDSASEKIGRLLKQYKFKPNGK